MMKRITAILLLLVLNSCERKIDLLDPEYSDGSVLIGTSVIPEGIKSSLEGIYSITKGGQDFGNEVACKWHGEKLTVFGVKKGTYFVMDGGIRDTTFLGVRDTLFHFEGKWRHTQSTDVGLLRLQIGVDEGARHLWNDSIPPESVRFVGSYGYGDSPNTRELEMEYLRPFSDEAKKSKFLIIAHRGGARNSDYLGVSENSIEMIAIAEELGGNSIEIDVKVSKDGIPFLYHDKSINLRLTREAPIWGPIEDFTFPQIRTFIKLVNGEKVPSLEEALEFVLNDTELRFVWLDMKSERNAMPIVIPIQQDINRRAKEMGRDLIVAIGLPSEDVQKQFMLYPGYENIASINERNIQDVRTTNSYAWGPRWTRGSQTDAVREMHNEGRIAITWTVDQVQFIEKFIHESEFDGFVTNYPTIVAYHNYAR